MTQPSPDVKHALQQASDQTGVPYKLLLAVAYVESRYNPAAVSPVGAQGLLQLMPRTAESLGVTDPFDPYDNALGGAKFLRRLHDKYGRWDAALAAYNWGPGNVDSDKDVPTSVQHYISAVQSRWDGAAAPGPTPGAAGILLATFISNVVHPFPRLRRG